MAGVRFALLLGCLVLAACQSSPTPPAPPEPVAAPPEEESWRTAVREADTDRLNRLDSAWSEGLAEARPRFGRAIDAEGVLLNPGAGLPRAALPPGSYNCRVIRLGAGPRRAAFTAYPSYFCYVGVEDELLAFTKQTGSERPAGYVWNDTDVRSIFLGTMVEGVEGDPTAYGQDPERDMVGIVERVGPFRYRIVFPWPRGGAKIEVLELVPVVPPAAD
ncbi:DUF4893 domain-containing protein [Sphingosinicella sp. LHD-64]|uniref:DUF4893 domain-containing protein n=1 Tax=Sphingosinicella sp. LHD-64 TaxID=3072139 RepID=UPI00280FBA53|nr:DUF4893 domain-containing protein [Sphingosinicella sp. LHD-64]MDQ8755142.1 DUF4893 domain-containing protein [Sphingosinicella sp. LHD-64]